jgi:hypothetical protein
MMVVAALCERQTAEVSAVKTPAHEALALGVRRAAAPGGPLPGEKLLALLQADQWDALARLGTDAAQLHRLPRGRRAADLPQSQTLTDLDEVATRLLHGEANPSPEKGETIMSYDTDIEYEQLSLDAGKRKLRKNTQASAQDLGIITTVLEIAALTLTTEAGKTFSFNQLMDEAREIGGKNLNLQEKDAKIVLKKPSFLKKAGKAYRLR